MSDYIKRKEYKLPDGRTVTADFNELGCAKITIQAMDALFDILNSSDAVEVVRCKDCKYATYDKSIDRYNCRNWGLYGDENTEADDFCSYGERADK